MEPSSIISELVSLTEIELCYYHLLQSAEFPYSSMGTIAHGLRVLYLELKNE